MIIYFSLQLAALNIILQLLLHSGYVSLANSDVVVPYTNVTAVRHGRHAYYIYNNSKGFFPDRYTMNRYGYDFANTPHVGREYINSIPDSRQPLPSLWDHHSNERMLSLGNSNFLLETELVVKLLNPCYVYWNNKIAITYRSESEQFKIILISKSSGTSDGSTVISGSSTDHIKADIEAIRNYNYKNITTQHIVLRGEDPRLITIKSEDKRTDRLFVVFCRRFHKRRPELQMAYAEIFMDETKLFVDDIVDIDFQNERPKEDQKNWSPLQVNDTKMLFIANFDPHRIVEVTTGAKSWVGQGKTVGLSTPFADGSFIWNFGEIRGGSPAIAIDESRYLSFFHCSNEPPRVGPDVLKTYAMGAYTFCRNAPYKVLSMSKVPIVHPSFYTGSWTYLPISYYHIDYVVFPMSFIIRGNDLYLMYGKQDQQGWVARLDLKGLLDSLTTINSSC